MNMHIAVVIALVKSIKNVSAKIVRICRDDAKRTETWKVRYILVEHS